MGFQFSVQETRDRVGTRAVRAAKGGVATGPSLDDIMPLIYDRLCVLARRSLAREIAGFEMQPEGVVNEAYMRLARSRTRWRSSEHVFCVAR